MYILFSIFCFFNSKNERIPINIASIIMYVTILRCYSMIRLGNIPVYIQWQRHRGGRGAEAPPLFRLGGPDPPVCNESVQWGHWGWSTMTEKRLNNCLLLNIHKDITDSLDLVSIAQEFVSKYDERKKYFGNFVD